MDTENIPKLLESVIKWQKESKRYMTEQIKSVPEITSFLKHLKSTLDHSGSVGEALVSLPQVGQLLGRICALPLLLSNTELYEALISCVLFFYVHEPKSSVEQQAKSWAVTQIRNTVCCQSDQLSTQALAFSGSTHQDYHQVQTDVVLHTLSSQLHTTKPDSPASETDVTDLLDLCRVCLHLCDQPNFQKLLPKLLHRLLISQTEAEDNIMALFKEIMQTQENAYIGTCKYRLTPECLALLWDNHLEALEQEVVCLVSWATSQYPRSKLSLTSTMKSRGVVEVCSRSSQVYMAVFRMLQQMYQDSDQSGQVAGVIWCLHQAIRQHIWNANQESISLSSLCPSQLQSLSHLLYIPTSGLSKSSCEHQVCSISRWIDKNVCSSLGSSLPLAEDNGSSGEDTPEIDADDLEVLLLQHQEWYHLALILALLAHKENVSKYVQVAIFFRSSAVEAHAFHIEDTVLSLRGLLSKITLNSHDLEYVVSASQASQTNQQVTKTILNQLLMIFMLCSQKGLGLAKDIFLHTGLEEGHSQLWAVLDTLDICLPYLSHWSAFDKVKKGGMIKLLDTLLDDMSSDLSDDLMDLDTCSAKDDKEQYTLSLTEWTKNVKQRLTEL